MICQKSSMHIYEVFDPTSTSSLFGSTVFICGNNRGTFETTLFRYECNAFETWKEFESINLTIFFNLSISETLDPTSIVPFSGSTHETFETVCSTGSSGSKIRVYLQGTCERVEIQRSNLFVRYSIPSLTTDTWMT